MEVDTEGKCKTKKDPQVNCFNMDILSLPEIIKQLLVHKPLRSISLLMACFSR